MSKQVRLGSPAIAAMAAWLLAAGVFQATAADVDDQARRIISQIGVDRGICVLAAPNSADLAVAMARQSELTIYMQQTSEAEVAAARRQLDAAGLLGTRVYVEQGPSLEIHLADNLADAVVVPRLMAMTPDGRDALLRTVRPLGTLLLADGAMTKPYPADADHWTHAYHGPDNNPQSEDQLARAPYLTQFLAEPWYVPFPEVTVTSAGRVFKAFGHVGYKERDWPWVNTLVAINGYNGTMLWKRSLEEGFNIHRNTMVATPEILYVADSKSCKLLDAATGEVTDQLKAPDDATGQVWKWMAIEDGILYALVGEQEVRDPTLRGTRTGAGWPWRPMTGAYDQPEYPWGFGRTFFAMDLQTKKVLWMHKEEQPVDGRAVAMKNGRIYYYSHPNFVACLDAKQGKPAWRTSDPKLLEAIGPHHRAQTASIGFSTSSYLKCGDGAIYFAGPQRTRLVAVSSEDGKLLWQYPHGNLQLVLRDEGLYAMGRTEPNTSFLFDPLTGRIKANLNMLRGNCTRATGTVDSIFTRGSRHGGTTRLAVADNRPQRIALMRPDCHDGVIAAEGFLYWGPWMCDCSISLVGLICLGHAGDFQRHAEAVEAERLASNAAAGRAVKPLAIAPGDWPAYRADNRRLAASKAVVPAKVARAWQYRLPGMADAVAPVTAGGMVFVSGSDGVIRALEAATGKVKWSAYTGGPISYPPAIEDGRLFVGSGDGWVYAFEAATGAPLWRFRAAPDERKINLYGKLASTWPVAGGALVADGVVYAAAGIASYDGTHVYALDAATGRIRWQNNTSGQMMGEGRTVGVSVQGHLLLHDETLYLAGGNVVSPARYDVRDGRCLNTLTDEQTKAPRGRELFLVGGQVVAFERLLYSPKRYWPGRYFAGHLLQARSGDVVIRGAGGRVARIDRDLPLDQKPKALWEATVFERSEAMALGNNAVVVAGSLPSRQAADAEYGITCLSVEDGRALWKQPLPAMPVSWGMALDGGGRIVVALQDGSVLCFAAKQ